jgi:hypothetical protein
MMSYLARQPHRHALLPHSQWQYETEGRKLYLEGEDSRETPCNSTGLRKSFRTVSKWDERNFVVQSA